MKRIMAMVAAMVLLFTSFAGSALAEAAGKQTPSGIAYADIGSSIDSFISEREAGLASCVVSVFDADGVIHNGYYGYADIENGIPADADTVYEWASCSKLLVWVAVMQQWERGNLDLEADIRTYLPEGFLTKLQYPDEKITMLNLMNHNAGFQESFYENQLAGPDDLYANLEEVVRACECYQAYHVGEYTAYSNWGTALAAYIVERTSGVDYVTYVNENIFAPLGMEHTSIDPLQADNAWVAEKRSELKCYSRYGDPAYNEDYGECRSWVQLFPAGAAIGTVTDFSAFTRAFVSAECPLFENVSTRDMMLQATSFYGSSDIAMNCHGLWTNENLVQTLGHAGNSGGCTSNLVFDPISGLGMVIMTNEPGETAFCYGLPAHLFGSVTDRPEYRSAAPAEADVSGYYFSRRSLPEGVAKAMTYTGAMLPLSRNEDGTYSMKLLGLTLNAAKLVPLAENQYVMLDNGMEMFMYIEGGKISMMSADYVRDPLGATGTVCCFGFILFGFVCLAVLLCKLVALLIRKVRKRSRKYSVMDRQILLQQVVYGVSGVIFALFILIGGFPVTTVSTAVSGILAALLALISLANGGLLCYNREQHGVRSFIWAALSLAYAAFIVLMQLYCFWKV